MVRQLYNPVLNIFTPGKTSIQDLKKMTWETNWNGKVMGLVESHQVPKYFFASTDSMSVLPGGKSLTQPGWKMMLKVIKSAIMNIFQKKNLFKSFVKIELSYAFTINLFTTAEKCMERDYSWKMHGKGIILFKNRCFSLVSNYLRPSRNSSQLIFNINAVVLIVWARWNNKQRWQSALVYFMNDKST